MGMIGYALNHAEKQEWSEGIATLEKREDIIDHLISETEWCVATPKQSDKCYRLFNLVGITSRSRKWFSDEQGWLSPCFMLIHDIGRQRVV